MQRYRTKSQDLSLQGSKSFTLGCEFAGQLVSDFIFVDIKI